MISSKLLGFMAKKNRHRDWNGEVDGEFERFQGEGFRHACEFVVLNGRVVDENQRKK